MQPPHYNIIFALHPDKWSHIELLKSSLFVAPADGTLMPIRILILNHRDHRVATMLKCLIVNLGSRFLHRTSTLFTTGVNMDFDYLVEGAVELVPTKRQRTETVWDKCAICQTDKIERFVTPGRQGVGRLCQVAEQRKDLVHRRLQSDMENMMHNVIKWHKSCYSAYTSQTTNLGTQSVIMPDTNTPKSCPDVLRSIQNSMPQHLILICALFASVSDAGTQM